MFKPLYLDLVKADKEALNNTILDLRDLLVQHPENQDAFRVGDGSQIVVELRKVLIGLNVNEPLLPCKLF